MPKTLEFGPIQITIPDEYELPARAGQLTDDEIKAIHNPHEGLDTALANAAALLERFQTPTSEQPAPATDPAATSASTATPAKAPALTLPAHITPAALRAASTRIDVINLAHHQIVLAFNRLTQARLLDLAAGYTLLSELNDQVKAQGKNNEIIKDTFEPVRTYFKGKKDKKDKKDKKKEKSDE